MKLLAIVSIAASVFVGEAYATSFKNVANGLWSSGLNTGANPLTGGSIDSHYTLIQIPALCTTGDQTCIEGIGDLFGPSAYVVNGSNPLLGGTGNNGIAPLNGTWASGNTNSSQWLGPKPDQVGPVTQDPYSPGTPSGTFPNVGTWPVNGIDTNALYIYRTVFNLTALNLLPSSATVVLGWASDDPDNGLATTDPNYKASSIRICSNPGTAQQSCTAIPNSGNAGYQSANLTQVSIGSQYFTSGSMSIDFLVYNKPLQGYDPSGLRVEIISADATSTSVIPEPSTLAFIGLGLGAFTLLRRKH